MTHDILNFQKTIRNFITVWQVFCWEDSRVLPDFKMKIIELILVLVALQKIGETVSNLIKCLGTFKSPWIGLGAQNCTP